MATRIDPAPVWMPHPSGTELLERQVLVDLHDVAFGGQAVGGEARLAEPARQDLVAVAVGDSRGAVEAPTEQVAGQERVAVGGLAGQAVGAGAARVERQHDVIADGHLGDALTDGLDDARSLVPGDHRRRHGALGHPRHDVGVAHTGTDDTDEHLAGSGVGQLDGLDGVGAVGGTEDGGLDLHRMPRRSVGRSGRTSVAQHRRPDLEVGRREHAVAATTIVARRATMLGRSRGRYCPPA
jgi:hypothetical protein